MTRHAEVASSRGGAAARFPALAELAGWIGDPQVRTSRHDRRLDRQQRSGGRLSGGAAGARRDHRHQQAQDRGRRLLQGPVRDGAWSRARSSPGVASRSPQKAAYAKFRNPASRFALVGVFVAKRGADVRVAVTGAGANGVFRARALEEALTKRFAPKSLEGIAVSPDGLNSDIHGDAEYRAHLIGVMAKRAVRRAA